jgi:hypothetical protein
VAEPEPLGGTRCEVLHEHVGPGEQPAHDPGAAGAGIGLEVERKALLRPVEPHEVAGLAADGGVVGAGEVPVARPLDLDHAGAELGELAGGERRGNGLLAGDDDYPVQRQHSRIIPVPDRQGRALPARAPG